MAAGWPKCLSCLAFWLTTQLQSPTYRPAAVRSLGGGVSSTTKCDKPQDKTALASFHLTLLNPL